jgi:hypothetical protein
MRFRTLPRRRYQHAELGQQPLPAESRGIVVPPIHGIGFINNLSLATANAWTSKAILPWRANLR